jgi:hypothetical protein
MVATALLCVFRALFVVEGEKSTLSRRRIKRRTEGDRRAEQRGAMFGLFTIAMSVSVFILMYVFHQRLDQYGELTLEEA